MIVREGVVSDCRARRGAGRRAGWRRGQRQPAFTIVELLVTIAIIR
jgi:hypothetical protein